MRNRKQGFTLIELLIVIAIIGILAAVLIPNLLRSRQVAQDRAGDSYMRNVYTAAQAYLAEVVTATTVETDCSAGYTPGTLAGGTSTYNVDAWDPIGTCTVTADGTGVTADWTGGIANAGTIP